MISLNKAAHPSCNPPFTGQRFFSQSSASSANVLLWTLILSCIHLFANSCRMLFSRSFFTFWRFWRQQTFDQHTELTESSCIPGRFNAIFFITVRLCMLAGKPSTTNGHQQYAQSQNDGACKKRTWEICNPGPDNYSQWRTKHSNHIELHNVGSQCTYMCTE